MAKLDHFIAALARDIALARVESDMESVKIAESYNQNEVMKSLDMSVPRMKIREVDINLEAFLSQVPDANTDETVDDEPLSGEEIIESSMLFLESKLVSEEVAKERILKTAELSKRYVDRYIPKDFSAVEIKDKLETYLIKKMKMIPLKELKNPKDDLILEFEKFSKTALVKMKSPENSKKDGIEIEFSEPVEKSNFAKATIKLTLVEDDVIWGLEGQ